MAKVNVEFDTKDKTLNVTMDGKVMENVVGADFYYGFGDGDSFHGTVTMVEKVDNEDLVKVMRITANDGLVETTESSNMPELLAKKIFPKRNV